MALLEETIEEFYRTLLTQHRVLPSFVFDSPSEVDEAVAEALAFGVVNPGRDILDFPRQIVLTLDFMSTKLKEVFEDGDVPDNRLEHRLIETLLPLNRRFTYYAMTVARNLELLLGRLSQESKEDLEPELSLLGREVVGLLDQWAAEEKEVRRNWSISERNIIDTAEVYENQIQLRLDALAALHPKLAEDVAFYRRVNNESEPEAEAASAPAAEEEATEERVGTVGMDQFTE